MKNAKKPGMPLLMHDEPIFLENKIIGYSTSSNYSFNYEKNIFLAYVKAELDLTKKLSIEVEGNNYLINHEAECMHDPKGTILRN